MPSHRPNTLPLFALALLITACVTSSNRAPRGPEPAADPIMAVHGDAGETEDERLLQGLGPEVGPHDR